MAACKIRIIGKVRGEKIANSFVSNIWAFAKNIKVVEIGVNMFQIVFANLHDGDRVLSGRPWIYDNLLLWSYYERKVLTQMTMLLVKLEFGSRSRTCQFTGLLRILGK